MKNFILLNNKKIKNLIKIFFLFTVVFFLKLLIENRIEIDIFILLIFLFFINYFILYLYFSLKKEENYIPIYPLILFYYWSTVSLYFYFEQELAPFTINQALRPIELIYPDIILFIKVFSLGLIFFSSGYFILNFFNLKKISYNLDQINKHETYLVTFFLLFIPFYYINYELNFFKLNLINQLKQPIMIFVLSYFQIKYLVTKNIFFLLILIFLLSLLFFIEISFGSTLFPFMMIAALILLSFYKNKKINLANILLIFLSIYVVHSLKNEIRTSTWSTYINTDNNKIKEDKSKKQTTNSEILFRIKSSADVYANGLDKVLYDFNVRNQKNRLFHSNQTLKIVLTQTPNVVSFYNGESYVNILYKFIPRFFYKNKPTEEWGNFWGKRYEALNSYDQTTSWNFPILSEFYANFGIKGVIFGMFLLGITIKILLILLSFNFGQPVLLSMSSTIMLNFFFLESNLTMVLGAVIQHILFFTVIIFSIFLLNFLIKQISNFKI